MERMGQIMKSAPQEMNEVVRALSSRVEALVGDAGWRGDAAESFRKAWTANSIQAGALSDVVSQVGTVVDDLSAKLQDIENVLYDAAHAAQTKGVPIGPSGEPQPIMTAADTTHDPHGAAVAQASADYAETYDSAMRVAQGYRLNAAKQLSDLYDEISFDPGKQNNPDQWLTIGDYLRGLYVLPGEKNYQLKGKLGAEISDARDEMKDARTAFKAERAAYQAKGMKLPADNDARLAHSDAVRELRGLETELAAAEAGKGELPLTKALNTHLAEVAREIPQVSAVADALPKGLEFLRDIPVIDVAASGVAAELQAHDDIDKGWSPEHARTVDYGAAAVGLVGGAAVGATAAAFDVPVILAAGVCGAVAVGIGDLACQGLHEHWREDISQHGVAGGVLTGIRHTGANTGGDFVDMAVGIGHGARGLWHSVLG
jgi:uncharacterized protein YukE